jgi:N-acetylmuramic acid 6-phosphate etherase
LFGPGLVSAVMREPKSAAATYLGIEGGATRTVVLLTSGGGRVLRRLERGPTNMKLLSEAQLTHEFRSIAAALPIPSSLCIGLSGAWVEADFALIRAAAARAWPRVPSYATNDLETAVTAAGEGGRSENIPKVLVLSGTGSCCYAKSLEGTAVKVGGWGHMLGDKGSGYDIGLRALQTIIDVYDQESAWPALGRRLLRTLLLNEPNDLIDWAQAADKRAIASLAAEVFAAWSHKDRLADELLAGAAKALARDAAACARRVAMPGAPVQFVLSGSILVKQPRFAKLVGRELRKLWPKAVCTPLKRESVWGAVELARRALEPGVQRTASKVGTPQVQELAVQSSRRSPTEERNPRSVHLDKLPLRSAITLMLTEDASISRKLLAQRQRIHRVIEAVAQAFRHGGRLFYVGAGTSGRLGVLDASECPPTFSASPDLVQGIIAGGQNALWQSVEGMEDDADAGGRAIRYRGVARRDVVIGIAASGTTPFVWGALQEAKHRRATTVLVCFNPYLKIPRELRPTILIAANLGPEVLTGSTRLKAGTATKQLLNMFTTLAMVRYGKVQSNLMVDVNPANEKLRDRAVRIVQELTGKDYSAALSALEHAGWIVKKAAARLRQRSFRPAW